MGGRGASSGKSRLTKSGGGGMMKMNLQFFARKPGGRKVPKDNPLWASLVNGDQKWQNEQGVFEHEHGGYRYRIKYGEDYDYKILHKERMKNIHDGKY